MTTLPLPEIVAKAGTKRARPLDVRFVLDAGGDPFQLIMRTLGQVARDEAVELIVPFEPTPLYFVLEGLNWATSTECREGLYHVFIYRDPAKGDASVEPRAGCGAGPCGGRPELQPPVEMDVRDLEPPQPMVEILKKLGELGPGAQLIVRHRREPVLLYDKLKMRGYAAKSEQQPDGDWLVAIAPEWAI